MIIPNKVKKKHLKMILIILHEHIYCNSRSENILEYLLYYFFNTDTFKQANIICEYLICPNTKDPSREWSIHSASPHKWTMSGSLSSPMSLTSSTGKLSVKTKRTSLSWTLYCMARPLFVSGRYYSHCCTWLE